MTKCCNSTSLNLRNELIDLYYEYITNIQKKETAERASRLHLRTIRDLKNKLNRKLGLTMGTSAFEISLVMDEPANVNSIYLFLVKQYIKDYGIPDGDMEADKIACLIEKFKIPKEALITKIKINIIQLQKMKLFQRKKKKLNCRESNWRVGRAGMKKGANYRQS